MFALAPSTPCPLLLLLIRPYMRQTLLSACYTTLVPLTDHACLDLESTGMRVAWDGPVCLHRVLHLRHGAARAEAPKLQEDIGGVYILSRPANTAPACSNQMSSRQSIRSAILPYESSATSSCEDQTLNTRRLASRKAMAGIKNSSSMETLETPEQKPQTRITNAYSSIRRPTTLSISDTVTYSIPGTGTPQRLLTPSGSHSQPSQNEFAQCAALSSAPSSPVAPTLPPIYTGTLICSFLPSLWHFSPIHILSPPLNATGTTADAHNYTLCCDAAADYFRTALLRLLQEAEATALCNQEATDTPGTPLLRSTRRTFNNNASPPGGAQTPQDLSPRYNRQPLDKVIRALFAEPAITLFPILFSCRYTAQDLHLLLKTLRGLFPAPGIPAAVLAHIETTVEQYLMCVARPHELLSYATTAPVLSHYFYTAFTEKVRFKEVNALPSTKFLEVIKDLLSKADTRQTAADSISEREPSGKRESDSTASSHGSALTGHSASTQRSLPPKGILKNTGSTSSLASTAPREMLKESSSVESVGSYVASSASERRLVWHEQAQAHRSTEDPPNSPPFIECSEEEVAQSDIEYDTPVEMHSDEYSDNVGVYGNQLDDLYTDSPDGSTDVPTDYNFDEQTLNSHNAGINHESAEIDECSDSTSLDSSSTSSDEADNELSDDSDRSLRAIAEENEDEMLEWSGHGTDLQGYERTPLPRKISRESRKMTGPSNAAQDAMFKPTTASASPSNVKDTLPDPNSHLTHRSVTTPVNPTPAAHAHPSTSLPKTTVTPPPRKSSNPTHKEKLSPANSHQPALNGTPQLADNNAENNCQASPTPFSPAEKSLSEILRIGTFLPLPLSTVPRTKPCTAMCTARNAAVMQMLTVAAQNTTRVVRDNVIVALALEFIQYGLYEPFHKFAAQGFYGAEHLNKMSVRLVLEAVLARDDVCDEDFCAVALFCQLRCTAFFRQLANLRGLMAPSLLRTAQGCARLHLLQRRFFSFKNTDPAHVCAYFATAAAARSAPRTICECVAPLLQSVEWPGIQRIETALLMAGNTELLAEVYRALPGERLGVAALAGVVRRLDGAVALDTFAQLVATCARHLPPGDVQRCVCEAASAEGEGGALSVGFLKGLLCTLQREEYPWLGELALLLFQQMWAQDRPALAATVLEYLSIVDACAIAPERAVVLCVHWLLQQSAAEAVRPGAAWTTAPFFYAHMDLLLLAVAEDARQLLTSPEVFRRLCPHHLFTVCVKQATVINMFAVLCQTGDVAGLAAFFQHCAAEEALVQMAAEVIVYCLQKEAAAVASRVEGGLESGVFAFIKLRPEDRLASEGPLKAVIAQFLSESGDITLASLLLAFQMQISPDSTAELHESGILEPLSQWRV